MDKKPVTYTWARRPAARIAALFLALLLVCAAAPSLGLSRSTAYADSSTVELQIEGSFIVDSTRQMLESINDLRKNDAWYWNPSDTEKIQVADLSPLSYDYELERVAMQRAAELAIAYSHTRPNGESCFTAYTSAFSWSSKGENIAYGYRSADSVFTAWAEADEPYSGQGHRRNMLNSKFTTVGIGCFECDGILFWAQEFSGTKTNAVSNPLSVPVGIETLTEHIASASIGGQIHLQVGSSVDLSSIGFYVVDAHSPRISVPCHVSADDFRVENTGIARIDNGKLEALQNGETTLTATHGSLSASAIVSVSEDSAIPLHLAVPVEVTIPAGETVYFSYTPAETGTYVFYATGDYDTLGALYSGSMVQLKTDDDSGGGNNFSISYELTAGTPYIFGASMYYSNESGLVTVALEKDGTLHSGGFSYTILSDGTASIVDCSLTGNIVIPSTLDGYTVTNLASQLFFGRSGLTSVTLPATVTYFGTNKLDNNWDYVFSYCFDLENIFVDSQNPTFQSIDGVLYSKDGKTMIHYPCNHAGAVYHVSADTLCCTSFASARNLRFLFLENPNTVWFTYTFFNTEGLTTFYSKGGAAESAAAAEIESGCSFVSADEIVTLPGKLKTIESEAFRNTAILYVIIPDGCETVEAGAFTGGPLVFAQVGSSTRIEDAAFDGTVVIERR